MRHAFLAFLALSSCLAPTVSVGDGGVSEAGPYAACFAAGGGCFAPASCPAQIGDLACGTSGAICCTTAPAATAPADAAPAPTPDAAVTAAASSCDLACETTCVGDPNCITMCGC